MLLILKNSFCLLREDLDKEVIPLSYTLIIPTNHRITDFNFKGWLKNTSVFPV